MEFQIRRITTEEAVIEAESEEEALIRLKYGLPDYVAWRQLNQEIQLITGNGADNGTGE